MLKLWWEVMGLYKNIKLCPGNSVWRDANEYHVMLSTVMTLQLPLVV